ncbi:hypothetical protein [Clostridium thermopalmarium]|uniref:GspE/PulE/PilB domain-containing protein n=1 Tax=Clostridium thermopalmarium TaxID=29373 RepID=UPI0023534788|nr:hypothetical protein [Clostridium thermopalmarium]
MNIVNKKRLGDLLVEGGKITKEQLKAELERQRITGIKLGELLIKDKLVSEEDILEVLEFQLGIQRVHLDMIQLDKSAVRAIPESLALKYNLIAIGFEGNKIKVAMSDPLNVFAIDDVYIATGKRVIPYIASKTNIEKAIDKYYSSEYVEKAAEELTKSSVKEEVKVEVEEMDDVKKCASCKAYRLCDKKCG